MSNAQLTLDHRIKADLQTYLGTPQADRTQQQYESLTWSLTQAAIDYATALINERVEARRAQQKQPGLR